MTPLGNPRRLAVFRSVAWLVFAALLLFAAIFLTRTARGLPPVVASHFDAAGGANGFMKRDDYIVFMAALTVILPLGIVGFLAAVYSVATTLKLPHRDYWMAPPRLAQTRSFLLAHAVCFGSLLVAFLCYVHSLVADANRLRPPHLSTPGMLLGLGALALCMLLWAGAFARAFGRPR